MSTHIYPSYLAAVTDVAEAAGAKHFCITSIPYSEGGDTMQEMERECPEARTKAIREYAGSPDEIETELVEIHEGDASLGYILSYFSPEGTLLSVCASPLYEPPVKG